MELVAEIAHWVPAMKLCHWRLRQSSLLQHRQIARYKQDAVKTLVAGHPILRFYLKLMTPAGFCIFLGIVVGLHHTLLLVLGIFFPSFGLLGGLLGVLTFLVTSACSLCSVFRGRSRPSFPVLAWAIPDEGFWLARRLPCYRTIMRWPLF